LQIKNYIKRSSVILHCSFALKYVEKYATTRYHGVTLQHCWHIKSG